MYKGWGEIWEGLARSAFEGTGFSLRRIVKGIALGNLLAVLPWAATVVLLVRDLATGLAFAADLPLQLALAACLISAAVYMPVLIFLKVSPLYAATLPIACVFYSAVAMASTWMSLRGRGISWKGRYYRPPAPAQSIRVPGDADPGRSRRDDSTGSA